MTTASTTDLAGFTADELFHEAVVLPRGALGPFPGIRVISRPGWEQVITPSFRQGGLNEVSLAQLSEEEADSVIAATIAEYDALGLRFRWTVGADSRPFDLSERLARHGLTGERVVVMAAAVAEIRLDDVPGVQVTRVDAANLERFAQTVGAGWGADPEPILAYHRALLTDPLDRHHCFLAERDGEPAGAANYAAFERSAHFMGGVVLPQHRERGVYRALLAARLRHAAGLHLGLVTTQARASSSAPILARLGFTPLCELLSFSNR